MNNTVNSYASSAPDNGVTQDVIGNFLFYRLFDEAENVRWRMSDIPWSDIDKDKVSPSFVKIVREIAFSELTTWSATDRFFKDFVDDADFTQWITVWVYEETKHPQALMRWLDTFGESFDTKFMMEGRKIYPFMKTRMGNLVMNILSEIEASSRYMGLYTAAEEPVLKLIGKHLAADEARHASGFYAYAKKILDNSKNPDVERLQSLKVLSFWLLSNKFVKHPVAWIGSRLEDSEFAGIEANRRFETERVHAKMKKMIGNLVGFDLSHEDAIATHFRELYGIVGPQRI